MKSIHEIFGSWLHHHPLVLVLIPLMTGIACGESVPPYLGMSATVWWIFISVSILISVFVLYRNRRPGVVSRFPLLSTFFVTLFSFGVLLIGHHVEDVNVVWSKQEMPVALRLMESPTERGDMWRLRARIFYGEHAGRDLLVQLGSEGHATPCPGDIIYASALVRTPHSVTNPGAFDYARYLCRQGVSGQAYITARDWAYAPPEVSADVPIALRFARYRQTLVDRYAQYLDDGELRLVAAMTLGDKRGLNSEIRQSFSATGTSHVLALSGLHLGILFGIFSVLVRRGLRRRPWQICAGFVGIALLWGFVLLTGSPLSLVRAAIMYTIFVVANMFYRERSSFNNLSLAALLILLFSPASLFDVGFQLSFLSVFSILLLSSHVPAPKFFCRLNRASKSIRWFVCISQWFYDIFLISLVAQLGTLPLVAYYFHTVSLVGCLANVVIVPLVYAILVVALLFLLLPIGANITAWLLSAGVMMVERVTATLSALPYSHLEIYPHWSEVLVCYLLFGLLYGYLITRNVRCLWGMSLLCVLWFGIGEWKDSVRRPVPSLVIYENYAVPMVHVIASADRSWLWTTDSTRASESARYLQQDYWTPCGIRSPHLMQADSASQHLLSYHGVRLAWVTGRLPKERSGRPDTVTHLLLVRGSVSPLSHLLTYYRPRHILLDGSLTERWRSKYRREADSLHVPVYDIRLQGVWIEPLTE